MIFHSRKEHNEVLKWSKYYSPIMFLVLSMDGKWGGGAENAENITSNFKRLWPAASSYIKMQARMNAKGRIPISELTIPFPSREYHQRYGKRIIDDFLVLVFSMNRYLDDAEDYAFMESFCGEMLGLFHWEDRANEDIWTGSRLFAIDKQERFGEAIEQYRALGTKTERIGSIYAASLLDRCDADTAAEVLEPFRGSEDPAVREKISLLDQLKKIKE